MELVEPIFCSLFLWLTSNEIVAALSAVEQNKSAIKRRSLIFPVTAPTRVQFIGGIGIPVEDLAYESITSGYVLKAEYFLPSRAEQLRPNYLKPQLIHRRSVAGVHDAIQQRGANASRTAGNSVSSTANCESQQQRSGGSAYRWILYKSIELLLNRVQQPGRACLLRSICEHAALPLSFEGDLLSEILHIILTPSTSLDASVTPADAAYLRAEKLGRAGADCAIAYTECTKSPMDHISTVLEARDEM